MDFKSPNQLLNQSIVLIIFLDFNKPMVSANPSNVVLENSKLTLNCSADALPLATSYAWYFKGKLTKQSSESFLTLDKINEDNAGSYTCKVSHILGKKEANLVIDVKCKYFFCC